MPTSFGPTFVRISGAANAPPLVLLHGAATSSLMWAPNIEALSARCRTFAVDEIGDFGKSVCEQPVRRFEELSGWITELLDGLELRGGVNLAGLSYGGSLAADYALRFPERIGKLVLIAPGGTVLRLSPEFIARLVLAVIGREKGLAWVFRWLFEDAAREQPEWLDATQEQLRMHMRCVRRVLPNPRVWSDAEWRALRVPTLFLVGGHEKIYPPEKAVRRLKRVAPQVKAEIIAGAGHDLTFVRTAEVNRRICEFLTDSTSTST